MNIQQLKYLIATADEGTMTAAAASLYVAQPALSRAVRSLERELGVTVFDRSSRGARLTPAGEVVVARARRVLRSLAALQQARDAGERESPVHHRRIAHPPGGARHPDPAGAAATTATRRRAGCSAAGGAAHVHELVRTGRADLGICDQTLETDLVVIPVGKVEVQFVSPAALELPDPLPLTDLAGIPLVLPTMGSDRRAALDAFYAALGVDPFVAVESDERSVWMEAVRHGLASCLWHSLDSRWLPPGDVRVRSLDPPLWQELSVVHRDETEPDPRLDVVRRYAELVVGG